MGQARARAPAPGVTLDAGALIALERGDGRMIALLAQALKQRRRLRIPAGVVGQVWRGGARQATLARLLRASEVEVVALDGPLARACGELCGSRGTFDVIDASVVLVARAGRDVILTSDSEDLRRLDPKAAIVAI